MMFSIGNLNESGDRAAQVEQGVHLYRSLLLAKVRPRKDREAEINRGGVQCVHGGVEVDAERAGRIHRTSDMNRRLREVGVDAPIAGLIGVRQSGPRNVPAESEVIKLLRHGTQAGFAVAQTIAKSQLRETHAQKPIPAGKTARFVIASVARHAFLEFVDGQVFHPLGEDQLACVHALLSSRDPNGIWTANRPKKVQVEKSTNRVYPSDKARVARADRNRNRTAVNGRYGRDRGEGLSDRVRDSDRAPILWGCLGTAAAALPCSRPADGEPHPR